MVQADANNTSSLITAFKGANLIFGVTDFWTIFKDPESQLKKKPDQDVTEYCFEVELQQGKNLADAAATVTNLHRYIFSSMASATKWSNGKFKTLYHMDSKALAVDYAKSLPQLVGKFSQVQAPIYFNLLWEWGLPTTPKKVCSSKLVSTMLIAYKSSNLMDLIEFKELDLVMFLYHSEMFAKTLVNVSKQQQKVNQI